MSLTLKQHTTYLQILQIYDESRKPNAPLPPLHYISHALNFFLTTKHRAYYQLIADHYGMDRNKAHLKVTSIVKYIISHYPTTKRMYNSRISPSAILTSITFNFKAHYGLTSIIWDTGYRADGILIHNQFVFNYHVVGHMLKSPGRIKFHNHDLSIKKHKLKIVRVYKDMAICEFIRKRSYNVPKLKQHPVNILFAYDPLKHIVAIPRKIDFKSTYMTNPHGDYPGFTDIGITAVFTTIENDDIMCGSILFNKSRPIGFMCAGVDKPAHIRNFFPLSRCVNGVNVKEGEELDCGI